jgi:hypothetical protein
MRQVFNFTFILLLIGFQNICSAQQGTYALKFDGNKKTLEAWVIPNAFSTNHSKIDRINHCLFFSYFFFHHKTIQI